MQKDRYTVRKIVFGVAFGLALTGGVAACGSSSTSTNPAGTSPASTSPATTTPPTTAPTSGGGVSY